MVVKNYPQWSNRSNQGTTKNITFENCLLWTDLAQSMEIGYETVGSVMEDITFNNITVLHNFHKAPISIHNGNNANIKRVKFTNITVEDGAMGKGDGTNILIDFSCEFSATWSTQHATTSLGSIDGVEVTNVNVIKSDSPIVKVYGAIDGRDAYKNSMHMISNVTFTDVLIGNELLTSKYLQYKARYTSNIFFKQTNNEVIGATINKKDSSSYGSNYQVETIKK